MAGMCTSHPIALISCRRGIDVETYASELDCVLSLIDNGRLGQGVGKNTIGWGSESHKAALALVEEKLKSVTAQIAEEVRCESTAPGSAT